MNEMVLRECEDENILAYSEKIRSAGNTLLGLINDILDFSKIEAGKMDIIPVDYDLASVLNDLVTMIHTRADAKGLELILDIDGKTPKLLHGDEIRIKQIITNILTNAVKYTEKGSVTFAVGFERAQDDDGCIMLKVSISDTGIGIKPEDIPKLFTEFERIEETRNRSIEGTGLGMNITQRLLAMMNSRLGVQSEYGKGSVFSFELKQRVVKWEPVGNYEEAFRRSVAERKKYREKFTAPDARILVVDDTPMNLEVFVSLLRKTLVRIDTADSGARCLELAAENKYDVIFLDHMMPDMDGIETLQKLKAMRDSPNVGTPSVCLTANAVSGARETYLAAGFDDYLTKPIEPDKLEAMLIEYLPENKVNAAGADNDEAEADTSHALPEFILAIDEIDANEGIRHCGNEEIYLQTLTIYADTVSENADEIAGYLQKGDLKNATVKIHALKSTSRVIGAAGLGSLAEMLEKAGNENDIKTVNDNTDELLTRYRALGEALSPLLETAAADENDDLPEIPPEELSEIFTAIGEFMSVADYDSAVELIEGLREHKFPENEKDRCNALLKAAAEVRYELIDEILQKGE